MIRAFGGYAGTDNCGQILFWGGIVPSAAKAELISKLLCTA
jgi:hypothetical protein